MSTFAILPLIVYVATADDLKRAYLTEFVSLNRPESRSTYSTVYRDADSMNSLPREELDNVIRRGIPTVLKNIGSHLHELRELSCDDFAEKWPSAYMRAEYTGTGREVMVQLGDKKAWINNTRAPAGVSLPEDCDSEDSKASRPSVSPYTLHIKDRVKRTIKLEVSRMFPGLPQAQSSTHQTLLDAHTRDSIEFWFQQVGGGTFAHNDGYCHSVMSLQLRGKKKWSFMLSPEIEDLSRDVFDEFDSGIYESQVHTWVPDFETILEPGDAVYFPPGFMHETRTVEGPSSDTAAADQCATSMTFNVPLPMPSRYIRTFLNRFSASPEISHCMPRWESYVTMNSTLQEWGNPTPDSTVPFTIASQILQVVDTNTDSVVTLEELEFYFSSQNDDNVKQFYNPGVYSGRFGDLKLMFDPRYKLSKEMIKEGLMIRAKDTLEMWDIDGDKIATKNEIESVIEYFHYYKFRTNLIDTATKISDPNTGERKPLHVGTEAYKERLEIVDMVMKRIRPNPPTLKARKETVTRDEL